MSSSEYSWTEDWNWSEVMGLSHKEKKEKMKNKVLLIHSKNLPLKLCKTIYFQRFYYPLIDLLEVPYPDACYDPFFFDRMKLYFNILGEYKKICAQNDSDILEKWSLDFFLFSLQQVQKFCDSKVCITQTPTFGSTFCKFLETLILALNSCGGEAPCRNELHSQLLSVN